MADKACTHCACPESRRQACFTGTITDQAVMYGFTDLAVMYGFADLAVMYGFTDLAVDVTFHLPGSDVRFLERRRRACQRCAPMRGCGQHPVAHIDQSLHEGGGGGGGDPHARRRMRFPCFSQVRGQHLNVAMNAGRAGVWHHLGHPELRVG